jgi:predicted AlkP superfamily pyrophosphatase or phosphodiesterase
VTETLIIFIDGLPYKLLPRTSFLNSTQEKWSIQPGFGYSVNIHAELFAGLLPDEVGYFGEWMYNPKKSPGRRLKPILPILDSILRPYILNRGLQTLLTKGYYPDHVMPNIPLRHLDKFSLEGRHIQSPDFPFPTLFTQFPGLHTLNYRGIGREKGERDSLLFSQGLKAMEQFNNVFIPLPDLDGFGHRYGIDAESYRQHLAAVDDWCRQLSYKFLRRNEDGHIFIISDHGMANVVQGVHLDIEERILPASERTFLYFSDANLLRIWLSDQTLHPTILEYLNQLPYGRIVSAEDRQVYGLTSPRFGEFIFVLNEGWAFQPSTFARKIPRGMHGYHPTAPYQQAVALHIGPTWRDKTPERMRDVYHVMSTALKAAKDETSEVMN